MTVTNSQLIRMLEAREKYERARLAKTAAEEAKVAAELEVHEAMEGAGDKVIVRDLGPPWGTRRFVPNATIYADIYDEDELREWAVEEQREREFFPADPEPRKKPLNQYLRRVLQTPGMNIPPGVQQKRSRYVTVTEVK